MARKENGSGTVAIQRRGPGPSVGEIYLQRVTALLAVLGAEPKHAELDSAYLAVKEAHERMVGAPSRVSGKYTDKGEPLMVPAQEPCDPSEAWDRKPIALETAAQEDAEAANEANTAKGNDDASNQQGATSGNGDSGASPNKIVLP